MLQDLNKRLNLGLQFPTPNSQVPSAALGLSDYHGKGQKVFCAALGSKQRPRERIQFGAALVLSFDH